MSKFEDEIFGNSVPIESQLLKYGFVSQNGVLTFETYIINNQFCLKIEIENEKVQTNLIDKEFNEPYVLYKFDDIEGEFNGKIKTEISKILKDIKEKCFDKSIYKSQKTKTLFEYAKQKYGAEPEFLWAKFPDYSILRRKESGKWFAVIGTLNVKKLGLNEDEQKEIVVIRGDPTKANNKTIFEGWHMNKKNWISIILDDRISDEELFLELDNSFELAKK